MTSKTTSVGRSGIQAGTIPLDLTASVLSTLTAIETIAAREKVEPICRRLLDLRQRLQQNRFQVAVVGQFQRGKTSVLNALLGSEVLPVGTLPFTSVLTIVKYGALQSAEVLFQSGERLAISLGELPEYVTEAGNPCNVKNVEHVELSYPSELLRGGVTVTNCPGFGSLSDRNTHTAYEFLPRVDAAIFVTSPDPPLTSAEAEFLKRLSESVKQIFLVMNKIDLLDPVSVAPLLEFTQNAVATVLGTSIPAYAVSARDTLSQISNQQCDGRKEYGFYRLQSDLRNFLKEGRSDVFQASILRSLLNSVSDLRIHLQVCVESAAVSLQDIKRKQERFEQELAAALHRQQHNEVSFEANIRQLAGLVESETSRFAESRRPLLDTTVRAYFKDRERLSKNDLVTSLHRFVGFQIQHIFDQWLPDFESSLGHAIRDASAKHLHATNDVLEGVRNTAFALFGAELSSLQITEELPVIRGGFRIDPAAQASPKRPIYLLPPALFRWRLLHSVLMTAPLDLERTGWLVARDLKASLNSAIEIFADSVRDRLLEIVDAVRLAMADAIARHEYSELYDGKRLTRLSADIDQLDRISKMLHAGVGAEYAVEA